MTEYYSENSRLFVAVDCIVFGLDRGELSLLLARRRFEPERGKWSLMGGFVESHESIDDAASRVLTELTGLQNVYMDQVGAFGSVDRDPGERVVSIAYTALIDVAKADGAAIADSGACWIPLRSLPELGFDHPLMIEKSLAKLRRKLESEPLAFNLLPELFTLTQLQMLYETILGEEIDKRNFRKRVAELNSIVATDQIDKTNSRRGARMYRFDREIFSANPQFKI